MRQRRLTDVGKAVGKILRHHRTLQVNSLGFAWMTDVSQRVWDDEGWRPTEPEILMAVAKDENCRLQAEYLEGVHYSGDRKWIIRAVQGHSNSIGRQMRDVDAYEAVDKWSGLNMAVHGTRFDLLPAIIGVGPLGLLPGGLKRTSSNKRGQRTHVHCSMYAPSDPRLVAGFRREGTDVAIRLDLPQMFADKVTIFKSKADVLLLPNVVGPQHILTIQVLPRGVTLYRRPTVRQYREHLATIHCVVPACGREWRIGTQLCLECGEPITSRAIADIAQQLPSKFDRSVEVKRRYGLAMSQYASFGSARRRS
mgnify:CR=1 FL=1